MKFEHDSNRWDVEVELAEAGLEIELSGASEARGIWLYGEWEIEWEKEPDTYITDELLRFLEDHEDEIEIELIVYEVEDDDPGDAVGRIGGRPIGVRVEDWPRYDGTPMIHLVTVPAEAIVAELPEETVAVALFCHSPETNEAFEPGTSETEVRFLTEADIALGETLRDPANYPEESELPPETLRWEKRKLSLADARNESLSSPIPFWIQGPESDPTIEPFFFQFDEELVEMNLGDAGVMYVFSGAAWWQCY